MTSLEYTEYERLTKNPEADFIIYEVCLVYEKYR